LNERTRRESRLVTSVNKAGNFGEDVLVGKAGFEPATSASRTL
jgi:hypothetical protein